MAPRAWNWCKQGWLHPLYQTDHWVNVVTWDAAPNIVKWATFHLFAFINYQKSTLISKPIHEENASCYNKSIIKLLAQMVSLKMHAAQCYTNLNLKYKYNNITWCWCFTMSLLYFSYESRLDFTNWLYTTSNFLNPDFECLAHFSYNLKQTEF